MGCLSAHVLNLKQFLFIQNDANQEIEKIFIFFHLKRQMHISAQSI